MPSANGLFHRAIIQSGATLQLVEPEQATRVAETLIAKLGVSRSQLRRLQELPLEQIMSAYFAVVREMNVTFAGSRRMTAAGSDRRTRLRFRSCSTISMSRG